MRAAGRQGILFAAFIGDAEARRGGRLSIRNYPVLFPHLKRHWVACIIQADSKFEGLVVRFFMIKPAMGASASTPSCRCLRVLPGNCRAASGPVHPTDAGYARKLTPSAHTIVPA